jgi:hypothetical protein
MSERECSFYIEGAKGGVQWKRPESFLELASGLVRATPDTPLKNRVTSTYTVFPFI